VKKLINWICNDINMWEGFIEMKTNIEITRCEDMNRSKVDGREKLNY
jgi:hypothetical protein